MDQIPLHSRYRGEGILCGTPEEVWDCIKPVASGLREKWDDNVSSFEIVQSITDVSVSGCVICSVLSCCNTPTPPLWRGIYNICRQEECHADESSLVPGRKQCVSERLRNPQQNLQTIAEELQGKAWPPQTKRQAWIYTNRSSLKHCLLTEPLWSFAHSGTTTSLLQESVHPADQPYPAESLGIQQRCSANCLV